MKKFLISAASILLVVVFAAVAPLRSAALTFLSAFRVSQANTIRITVTDVQELLENVKQLGLLPSEAEMADEAASMGIIGGADGPERIIVHEGSTDIDDILGEYVNILSSVDEFTAFDFKLPKSVEETPELAWIPNDSTELTLDVPMINQMLEKVNANAFLPDAYNGGIITIETPPAIAAEYENFILAATQMPVITAQDGIELTVIKDVLLSSSIIPYNIAQQLAMIDVNTRDVYLPVLVGVSREVNINGKTGYVYSVSDLGTLLNALDFGTEIPTMESFTEEENVSAIVWVNDGAIYMLMGQLPETELLSIARSVK